MVVGVGCRDAIFESRVEEARQRGRTEALIDAYGDKSIAVLPFINMSDDAGNEFFSDGLSEELLNLLARIPELRVISRTSAFSYKGKAVRLSQIATELNVGDVLEGSAGWHYSGDGNLALAAQHYQRALQLAPTNVRTIGDAAALLKVSAVSTNASLWTSLSSHATR
ncbi:MAG: hypothetical protein U5K38_18460 [Woeseiaceae bacterium]|nr:hypothetical protein [Woeseiaceae bacterium]